MSSPVYTKDQPFGAPFTPRFSRRAPRQEVDQEQSRTHLVRCGQVKRAPRLDELDGDEAREDIIYTE